MDKVIINLKPGTNLNNLLDRDVLMYDATTNAFYTVSPETFFREYEGKLNNLLKRYDSSNKEMKEEISKLKTDCATFMSQIKESNSKLISMVEKFIKEGEEA